jgi:aminoglycoside phosphotransferase (APT) family kinase protein
VTNAATYFIEIIRLSRRGFGMAASGSLSDLAFVNAWFAARRDLISAEEVRVTSVQRLTRGVSRQTWTIDATVDGRRRGYIARRDHETGAVIPTKLLDEYRVYRHLEGVDVPTARALWFEEDPAWLPDGRPCYIRERIDGDWQLPFIASDDPTHDEVRVAHSQEHLRRLAALHTADWEARGFGDILPVPASPAQSAATLIQMNMDLLEEFQFEPSPVLAEGISNLLATAPTDVPRVSLCKGTNGHGEEVWSDGKIVAMSDWELACLGDPAYDFSQLQEMIPTIRRDGRQVWGWDQALEFYAGISGIEVTMERVNYYRGMHGLISFLYTHNAAAQMRIHGLRDLRFTWTAWENSYRSNIRLAQEVGFEPAGTRIA